MSKKSFVLVTVVLSIMIAPTFATGQPVKIVEESKVTEVPEAVIKKYKLDTTFYKKHLDYKGFSILSSAKVSDAGLYEARYLIDKLLGERDDILQAMIKTGCRFMVMAPTEMTTDVPEQRHLKNDPKTNWDTRARGLGGKLSSCGEENLLNLKGDRYRQENILIHEFNHAIHQQGLRSVDPTFNGRLKKAYDSAIGKGLWKGTYVAENPAEYWAEGAQAYFDCMRPQFGANTREKLQKYDPGLFALVDEVYKQSNYRYVRYDQRKKEPAAALTVTTIDGLAWRSIGPTIRPGRVGDIVVDPRDRKVWYVVHASGGLWKTINGGTTWQPIFDTYVSYSIGCVTLDPKNPDVVWLGTGENQSQRSVGFGDGIYQSTDAGKSWRNVGLTRSEHIAKILVDPRNSAVVYAASQGPLWAPGGDRGLFKTIDGGKTWKPILQIGENTGVTDVVFDPRNPDVIYAASYQRRRNVGVLIGGGPESAIYKSVDAGGKWTKLSKGLPAGDLGRIALGVSPQQPDVVYALVTASGKDSGFFRSADGGETWVRRSNYRVSDPNYYGEIFPDPHKFDRVFAMDLGIQVTSDGGATFQRLNWKMHVDNHAIVFHPTDPLQIIVGNDGGLYESKDGGKNWKHFNNLPTGQYYRLALDNAVPFYNVYGGTQDNGTHGGPSRSVRAAGVSVGDWKVLGGGDGMQPRVDPLDPSISYVMTQNGALSRRDPQLPKGSKGIRPKTEKGAVRWNWDTPFIISPHASGRLYLAGSVLYRSDDRGDTWRAISPDLTRRIDRATVPVMGKLWGPNAVTPNTFTTDLSVASALDESTLNEGLLLVGTDDGLVQVSEDAGKNWRKIDRFPGVPEMTWVSDLCASRHHTGTIYATFNNWQRGDFKPYVLKSVDLGKTWTSIAANLPDRQPVWCIVEDHVNRNLLFVGTEFGLFFTVDGGKQWTPLRNGLPIVPVRDLDVQRREHDLVAATFGRGFYVLDDYTALRQLTAENMTKPATLFDVRDAYRFEPTRDSVTGYIAPNPPFGALFTYYLRDTTPNASITLKVTDAAGNLIAKLGGPASAGVHRVNWDLRLISSVDGKAPMVKPGRFEVTLERNVSGAVTTLGAPQTFEVIDLPFRTKDATSATP